MSPYFSKIARLLILLCGINALLKLPIFINKIQIFEIILGISLLIFGFPQLKKIVTQPDERRLWSFWTPIDSALVGLFGLMIINMVVHPTQHVLLEGLATFYVFVIYFIFSRLTYRLGDYMPLIKIWAWAGLITGFAGFFSLWLYYAGYTQKLVHIYDNSAYLGDIARMKGFSCTSNMLASLLVFSFFITNTWLRGYKQLIFNGLIFLMLIGTQSKEGFYFLGLLVLIGFTYLFRTFLSKRQMSWLFIASYLVLWLGSTVSTLWLFQSEHSTVIPAQMGEPIAIGGGLMVRPTGYWYLLDVAWKCVQTNPWLGVGLGEIETKTFFYQAAGSYPAHINNNEAHDLYWGMVAQMGVGYILFLIYFIWCLKKCIDALLEDATTPKPLVLSFQYIGLFILLDMLGDVGALHFRHYWIIFGLLSGIYALSKNNHLNIVPTK